MENVCNRLKVELNKKNTERNIEQQSKFTLNGIQKSFTSYQKCTFKQNQVLMKKPIHLGFAVLELSKLLLYRT